MSVRKKSRAAAAPAAQSAPASFGLLPEESSHHFALQLGAPADPFVYVSEHFERFENPERQRLEYALSPSDRALRVILPRVKWQAIEEPIQFDFNQRLRQTGLKTSRFRPGLNILPRLFGKELVVLCWAIEDADPGLIPAAIRNWQGLKPEERWWLYTATNAATGQAARGRGRGWRKALRFALTENPTEAGELDP
jgi:hypothetical protein